MMKCQLVFAEFINRVWGVTIGEFNLVSLCLTSRLEVSYHTVILSLPSFIVGLIYGDI